MKNLLTVLAILLSTPALAQINTSTSASAATATNVNTINLTAGTGGSTSATGGSVTGSGNSHATGGSVSHSGNSNASQSQSIKESGNSSNTYTQNAQERAPVSTAFAAPLAATAECMGSTSAGGQGVGFGLSLGITWHDADCERRNDAAMLYNMNLHKAAVSLMCQNENIAKAMRLAHTPCPAEAIGEDGSYPAPYPTPHPTSGRAVNHNP